MQDRDVPASPRLLPEDVAVVPMTPGDWGPVAAVLADGLATGHATFETTVPTWQAWDAAHLPDPRLLALDPIGTAIGWAALAPVSTRPAYAGVAELSVYVAAHARSQGVGRRLLDQLVTDSAAAGIWTLQASVLPENTASLALHAACGFRVVGTRERIARLHGTWRDTVLLERRIDD